MKTRNWMVLSFIGFWLSACGGNSGVNPPGMNVNDGKTPATEEKTKKEDVQEIQVEEAALKVQYGKYTEVNVSVSGIGNESVEWSLVDYWQPQGLSVSDLKGKDLLLFGTPLFSGKWCFTLGAKLSSGKELSKETCFLSEENKVLQYPRFTTDTLLTLAEADRSYSQEIEIDSSSSSKVRFEWLDGIIPEGFDFQFEEDTYKATLTGTTKVLGTYYFTLRVVNAEGIENSRQFTLGVSEAEAPVNP